MHTEGKTQQLCHASYRLTTCPVVMFQFAMQDDADSDAAPNEGDYELHDDFIDDSEVYEYYEGDWRKPKHTGFYINTVSLPCWRVCPSSVP